MVSKWWVACAAVLTLLAGCIDDAPGADPDPVNQGGADGGNETATPTNSTNAAPTASLEASATNGTAPLNVTLTLGGSDPDGDNLTWSLTVGNDTRTGDTLPATVNATLEAGNHTVTLVVSDGNLTGNATLVIAVAAGDVASGPCGGEPEPCVVEQLPWADRYSDGTCHATGTLVEVPGGPAGTYYVHERGDPPGTGQLDGGTWIYEEGNDIPGMQIDGAFEGGDYADCINGDIGIF